MYIANAHGVRALATTTQNNKLLQKAHSYSSTDQRPKEVTTIAKHYFPNAYGKIASTYTGLAETH